jgi:hypothetical protein
MNKGFLVLFSKKDCLLTLGLLDRHTRATVSAALSSQLSVEARFYILIVGFDETKVMGGATTVHF